MEHQKYWQLSADALNSTGGFDNGDMLIQFPRESDEKYKARKEIAFDVGYMKTACHRFASYLSKKDTSRQTNSEIMQQFIANADMQGNSLTTFINKLTIEAKARGTMLVLVDMPQLNDGMSQSEQINTRTIPYTSLIEPERVTDYKKDRQGLFEFIEFSDSYEIDGKDEDVTRRYDKQGWSIKKGDKEIDSGTYSHGKCPVLAFTESGSFPYKGKYYHIAAIAKRLYNLMSELDEVIRNQTFSIFLYHVPENQNLSEDDMKSIGATIGTSNALVYRGNAPSFATPTSIPAKTLEERIEKLEAKIDEISNNVELGAAKQSGEALALRFQNMNSDLVDFARRLEQFEKRIFDMVAAWMSTQSDVTINYPQEFNFVNQIELIEKIERLIAMGAPETLIKQLWKQLANALLPGMDEEVEAAINSEIEEANHERTE